MTADSRGWTCNTQSGHAMKIAHKTLASTLVTFIGAGIIAGVGTYGMLQQRVASQKLVQDEFIPLVNVDLKRIMDLQNSIELILNADRDAYQAVLGEKLATSGEHADQYDQIKADHAENVQQVKDRMALASEALPKDAQPAYARFVEEFDAWQSDTHRVVELAADPLQADTARRLSESDAQSSFFTMRDTIDELTNFQEAEIEKTVELINQRRDQAITSSDEASAFASRIITLFTGVAVVVVLLAVTINLFIARAIGKPIKAMTHRLRDIAEGEGDLTQRVDEQRRDELGELGRWFNTFVEKIHGVISQVRDTSREVAGAATQIAASSEQMAQGISEQNQQVTQISTAVEQMSASIIEVARKSGEAADSAQQSGKVASEGGEVVSETIAGMNAISQAVSASAASVSELGKRGEQIGEIIKVINDIADQTNLLALNAAIEAARAGEHGRGFAVVADEVRKLADRTTSATEEIAQSITAIQTETEQAVQRMNIGTDQVKIGVDKATQAGKSLEQIVAGAQSVSQMIQSIAAAAEQQSAASEEVSRGIQSVSAVTHQSAESANQAAVAASQLSNQAEQLQTLVSRFKL
ncbi:MAG: methyl-accepting chemotaxis protein [Phycisphaeraceae bacterium]